MCFTFAEWHLTFQLLFVWITSWRHGPSRNADPMLAMHKERREKHPHWDVLLSCAHEIGLTILEAAYGKHSLKDDIYQWPDPTAPAKAPEPASSSSSAVSSAFASPSSSSYISPFYLPKHYSNPTQVRSLLAW